MMPAAKATETEEPIEIKIVLGWPPEIAELIAERQAAKAQIQSMAAPMLDLKKASKASPECMPAVRLGEDPESREVWVVGKPKGKVTKAEAAFLRVLVHNFPARVKGEKLEHDAGRSSAWRTLTRLRGRDADFAAAILLARKACGGYGVASARIVLTQNAENNVGKSA